MMNYRGEVKEKSNQDHRILVAKTIKSVLLVISDTSALAEVFESNTSHNNILALTSSKAWKGACHKDLMERWVIGPETVKNMIRDTIKICMKGPKPTLNSMFNNNDRILQYPIITSDVFFDNFFASNKSGKSSRGYS